MIDPLFTGQVGRPDLPEFEADHDGAGRGPLQMTLARKVLEAAALGEIGRVSHRVDVRILRVVDPASNAEHPILHGAGVELAPTTGRMYDGTVDTDVLADAPSAEAGESFAGEEFADQLEWAEQEAPIRGDRLRHLNGVPGETVQILEPTLMNADADLARVVRVTPSEAEAPFEIGTAGAFGGIESGVERGLSGRGGRRDHGCLQRESQGISRFDRHAHLG